MTRQPLLKRRETPPPMRRVRFSVPEADAAALDALIVRAKTAGFEVDLEAALAAAHARIAQRLARELGDTTPVEPQPAHESERPSRDDAYAAE